MLWLLPLTLASFLDALIRQSRSSSPLCKNIYIYIYIFRSLEIQVRTLILPMGLYSYGSPGLLHSPAVWYGCCVQITHPGLLNTLRVLNAEVMIPTTTKASWPQPAVVFELLTIKEREARTSHLLPPLFWADENSAVSLALRVRRTRDRCRITVTKSYTNRHRSPSIAPWMQE